MSERTAFRDKREKCAAECALPEISRRRDSLLGLTRLSLLVLLISLHVSPAFSWGPQGHEYINNVAALKSPIGTDAFPAFFRSEENVQQLVYNGTEPDRWKRFPGYVRSQGHGPSHYANLDLLQYFPVTNDHLTAIQMYRERGIDSQLVGLLPYYIIETYEKLTVSFAEYRSAVKRGVNTRANEFNVLYYAGLLGHYVGDGSQPLHTTSHHHGWVGENSKDYAMDAGMHRRFEVEFVRNIKVEDFQELVKSPSRLHAPFAEIMVYLKNTDSYTERVYELDKAGAFSQQTSESLQFVKERLAAASQMLIDLWYTAWLESDKAERTKNGLTFGAFTDSGSLSEPPKKSNSFRGEEAGPQK
jgi:hypothetical protein